MYGSSSNSFKEIEFPIKKKLPTQYFHLVYYWCDNDSESEGEHTPQIKKETHIALLWQLKSEDLVHLL